MRYTFCKYDTVTSTNDVAIQLAEEGAPDGTVVIAREQVSGKGRRGRVWKSPPDSGVYLSMVVHPRIALDRFWQLTFIASLSAAEAVRRTSRLEAQIKWPNDVLVNGRKVAGILVEARKPSERIHPVAIIGIGINVNNTEFPRALAEIATSMAIEKGKPVPLQAVEREVLDAFQTRYEEYVEDGFRPILEAWRHIDCTVGRDVEVRTPEGLIQGTAVEVTVHGNLVLHCSDGNYREVTAGEVLFPG